VALSAELILVYGFFVFLLGAFFVPWDRRCGGWYGRQRATGESCCKLLLAPEPPLFFTLFFGAW